MFIAEVPLYVFTMDIAALTLRACAELTCGHELEDSASYAGGR